MQYKYLVIDSSLLAYRCWYSCKDLKTESGLHTGLEYGFIRGIMALARAFSPGKVVLAWDGAPTRCMNIYPTTVSENGDILGYKANRKASKEKREEPDWDPRLATLRDLCAPIIPSLFHPQTEADEQIARFVYAAEAKGDKTLIVSRDRDFHQLVSENTHLTTKEKDILYDINEVEQKWGVPPQQVVYRRAIEGDSSDEIQGIPRIPKEVIVALAKASNSLDSLLENVKSGKFTKSKKQQEKLVEGLDTIKLNYLLSELNSQKDQSYTLMETPTGNLNPLKDFCKSLDFWSLENRKEWDLFLTSPELP